MLIRESLTGCFRSATCSLVAGFAIVASVAAIGLVEAGPGRWTRIGPDGGQVTALAADPFDELVAYAGTEDGLYRTTDGGASWSRRSPGDVHGFFRWLAVDPLVRNRLFAAVRWGQGALHRSDDGGRTWVELRLPDGARAGAMAAIAGTPSTLYARSSSAAARSVDGGSTWVSIAWPVSSTRDVAGAPSDPRTVYLVSSGDLWRTGDGGDTWSQCRPPGFRGDSLRVTVDPSDPLTVYTPTYRGLHVSHDGCRSWSMQPNAMMDAYTRVVVDFADSERIFAVSLQAATVSTDGGATWTPFGPDGEDVSWGELLAQSPADPDRLWMPTFVRAGGPTGVFTTADNGSTWTIGVDGLTAQAASRLVVDPNREETIYAGAFRSTDLGLTWDRLDGPDWRWQVAAVAVGSPDVLYALGAYNSLYRSDDGAITWDEIPPVSTPARIRFVEVDPTEPNTLYVSVSEGSSTGLYRSRDRGETWEFLVSEDLGGTVNRVTAHPSHPGELWIGTHDGPWRSVDGGATWTTQGVGLEVPGGPRPWSYIAEHWSIDGVAVDPEDGDHLFAYSCGGLWASTDGGETWAASRDGLTVCHQAEDVWSEGCSEASSKTWLPLVCTGGPQSISFDPEDPSVVYAPTAFGPHRSLDGGRTWRPFTAGWGQYGTGNLIAGGGGRVLAGTSYSGVIAFDELGGGTPATPRDAAVD